MKHPFTDVIVGILRAHFRADADTVFEKSDLLKYLNIKTRSANRGSKARGAFANHYALYVLVEDYIAKGFLTAADGSYATYEGARFSDLFRRQRELPFGSKLQNHALNSRLNDEFSKYFPTSDFRPILRDQAEQRYWIAEALLRIDVGAGPQRRTVNIAQAIIEIVNAYVAAKRSAFEGFIESCKGLVDAESGDAGKAAAFVNEQLQPNVDARVFEIVSFAILKAHYGEQAIFWGWSEDNLQRESLVLYKTGRTNANDGGIDFVMKPLGRFFQVTETIDVNKYFLDIDKVHRFPLTFVIKSENTPEEIEAQLRAEAQRKYGIKAIVDRYMDAVEEFVNIPRLLELFAALVPRGKLQEVMAEIILQSRIEFNAEEEDEGEDDATAPQLTT